MSLPCFPTPLHPGVAKLVQCLLRAAVLWADQEGTTEKYKPLPSAEPCSASPGRLPWALRSSMNWQSRSSRRQSPPGWCLGRTILGAARGEERGGVGSRHGDGWLGGAARVAEASGGGRSDPGAAPRSPLAARAIQWTSEAGRSRALNLDGGLRGLRWAVSQCVGQWEGGRKRGCARLLGGGELLKVQCESGDISHLLETLPNYLLEVPEIKAAGGESRSSYLRRSEREGEVDWRGGWVGATLRGWGVGKNTHFKSCTPPLAGSAGAPRVAGVCVEGGSGGGAGGGGQRRRANPGVCLRTVAALLQKDFANVRKAPSCWNIAPPVGAERADSAALPGRAAVLGPRSLGAGPGQVFCVRLRVPYFAATPSPEL